VIVGSCILGMGSVCMWFVMRVFVVGVVGGGVNIGQGGWFVG
jgi:hypothetical protein